MFFAPPPSNNIFQLVYCGGMSIGTSGWRTGTGTRHDFDRSRRRTGSRREGACACGYRCLARSSLRLSLLLSPHLHHRKACVTAGQDKGWADPTLRILGFWDKNIVICAGAMPHRRNFWPPLGSRHVKLYKACFCLQFYS